MPVTPTYPGVYIEEVPSGVRTITGVATAITAFVGRTARGRTHHPVRIQSMEDYGRSFGGLSMLSPVSYAVQHFFANGGTDAIVVRCYRPPVGADGVATRRLPPWFIEAQGTLTLADNPVEDDTLTIGTRTYTFQEEPTEADEIRLGGTVDATRRNLVATINGSGTSGVHHGPSTAEHGTVRVARSFVGQQVLLTARTGGSAGNTIETTATFSASTSNRFDAPHLGSTRAGTDPTPPPVAATGVLRLPDTEVTEGDSMTIGDRTYAFQATLTDTPGNIRIGSTLSETRQHIVNAINHSGTAGDDYAASTEAHEQVSAQLASNNDIVLTARVPGEAGNEIELSSMFSHPDHGFETPMLQGGEDTSIELEATNPGGWGNNLRIYVDHEVADPTDLNAFNLRIEEVDPSLPATAPPLRSEEFLNLSVDPVSPRHVDRVLASRSVLVQVRTTSLAVPGEVHGRALTAGHDGGSLTDADISGPDLQANKRGIWALEEADLFNLLCIPPLSLQPEDDIGATTRDAALEYCKDRRAFLIVDPPSDWVDVESAEAGVDGLGLRDENAAVYFPRVRMADPLRENQLATFAPCGVIAGVYARTDARRGVWKAPAGTEATMTGVRELDIKLTDGENGRLNPLGVDCLRTFPVIGNVVWGARTLRGADQLASEWKYVPVRRMALFLQESLYRGLQWVVFEPNDQPLWSQIRLNVGSFMHVYFRQGAFQGSSPADAYLVKCDDETTTQADIDRGVVNVLIGFAPLKPAEFVFVRIQQLAGQEL